MLGHAKLLKARSCNELQSPNSQRILTQLSCEKLILEMLALDHLKVVRTIISIHDLDNHIMSEISSNFDFSNC